MTRRGVLLALGAIPLGAVLPSLAQQHGKVWRVGFLSARGPVSSVESDVYGAFPREMSRLGYVEGRNLAIEWRFADGRYERLPALAAELVRLKVDVMVANGTTAARAAQKATATIPIVMVNVGDTVASGFVASLARPGGNMTGLSNLAEDVTSKVLELLLNMIPRQSRVGMMVNPDNAISARMLKIVSEAAQQANVRLLPVEARTSPEIERAFSEMVKEKVQSVIVGRDTLFAQHHRQIAELAERNRLPSISGNPEYAAAGGLMGYGASSRDALRHVATYVDKIIRGAQPRDLPVEQPTKFELIVNSKTARALGITIPQSILVRADRVIE